MLFAKFRKTIVFSAIFGVLFGGVVIASPAEAAVSTCNSGYSTLYPQDCSFPYSDSGNIIDSLDTCHNYSSLLGKDITNPGRDWVLSERILGIGTSGKVTAPSTLSLKVTLNEDCRTWSAYSLTGYLLSQQGTRYPITFGSASLSDQGMTLDTSDYCFLKQLDSSCKFARYDGTVSIPSDAVSGLYKVVLNTDSIDTIGGFATQLPHITQTLTWSNILDLTGVPGSKFAPPSTLGNLQGTLSADSHYLYLTFTPPTSEAPIDYYELDVQYILDGTSDPSKTASYSSTFYKLTKASSSPAVVSGEDVANVLTLIPISNPSFLLIRVKAHSEGGLSPDWSGGLYIQPSKLKTAAEISSDQLKQASDALAALQRDASTLWDVTSAHSLSDAQNKIQILPDSQQKSDLTAKLSVLENQIQSNSLSAVNAQLIKAEASHLASDVALLNTYFGYLPSNDDKTALATRVAALSIYNVKASSVTIICKSTKLPSTRKKVTGAQPKCPKGYTRI